MTNKPECEDCENCASSVDDEREPEDKRCARHLTDQELAEELDNLDVPEFSWEASVIAAARDRIIRKVPLKSLVEGWAIVGEDGQITIEFVRADAIYPLSVFEDADDAARSLGDNQCGRIVKVFVVEALS